MHVVYTNIFNSRCAYFYIQLNSMTMLTHKECYLLFPDCRVYTGKYVALRSSAMFRFANVRCLPRWGSVRKNNEGSRGELAEIGGKSFFWPSSKNRKRRYTDISTKRTRSGARALRHVINARQVRWLVARIRNSGERSRIHEEEEAGS